MMTLQRGNPAHAHRHDMDRRCLIRTQLFCVADPFRHAARRELDDGIADAHGNDPGFQVAAEVVVELVGGLRELELTAGTSLAS